jgi:hypothetical protein
MYRYFSVFLFRQSALTLPMYWLLLNIGLKLLDGPTEKVTAPLFNSHSSIRSSYGHLEKKKKQNLISTLSSRASLPCRTLPYNRILEWTTTLTFGIGATLSACPITAGSFSAGQTHPLIERYIEEDQVEKNHRPHCISTK